MTRAAYAPDPPGPKGLPWFGSLGDLRRNPMLFFTAVSQRYGGIVRYMYGRKPTFLVSHPDLVREFLVDHRTDYVKNKRYAVLHQALGTGLLTSEGDTWKHQRRATQDALGRQTIRAQVPWTAEVVNGHLDRWEDIADAGAVHDVEPDLTLIIEYLIGCWIFGPAFRGEIGRRFTDLITSMRQNWPSQPRRLIALQLPPLGKIRRLKRTLRAVDDIMYEAIARQRRDDSEDYSLLSSLARAAVGPEGRKFSDAELRDQLLTLFHAGFETSASLLTFLFYRLSLQPEVRTRLFAEVDSVLDGRVPTAENLAQLEFTEWCLNETLRLYPPAYNFSRIALVEHTIGGYRIPKDSMVIVSPFATHRLPEIWPNPEGFDPDRFSPSASQDRSAFAFIPFGAGHRFCVGAPLAQVQTKIVTALICQRYELDVEAGYTAEPAPGTVMRPAAGMPMTIRRRHDAPARRIA
ncbi:MAG: cytochrome P450 [Acidobacteriota bacterium]|nr:cytochrome P450 [Acidobacteriota bacterium]